MNQQNKKIILTGGGSGGPVSPLLAVAEELKKMDSQIEFLFVGTDSGPEKIMAEAAGMKFVSIPAAKFRRYFSSKNFTDIFVLIKSIFAAKRIIQDFKPGLVFGAGGYVAVPVSWMARWCNVKVAMHQQDAQVGLANKLIAPFADIITATFDRTAKDFVGGALFSSRLKPGAEWTGNPVRKEIFDPVSPDAHGKFGIKDEFPVLLVVGGATGATQINQVVIEALPELIKSHQIIHITGPGKNQSVFKHPHYHAFEFLGAEYPDAVKIADIVLTRAGLSSIAELSVLGKVAIVVPMPNTHQEDNGKVLKERGAAVVLSSAEFTPQDLPRIIQSVKFNPARQKTLMKNLSEIMPHDAASRIANILIVYVR